MDLPYHADLMIPLRRRQEGGVNSLQTKTKLGWLTIHYISNHYSNANGTDHEFKNWRACPPIPTIWAIFLVLKILFVFKSQITMRFRGLKSCENSPPKIKLDKWTKLLRTKPKTNKHKHA
jgi:hypothetical protein